MDSGELVLGFPILYLKGMRIMMFQLSGFYYTITKPEVQTNVMHIYIYIICTYDHVHEHTYADA